MCSTYNVEVGRVGSAWVSPDPGRTAGLHVNNGGAQAVDVRLGAVSSTQNQLGTHIHLKERWAMLHEWHSKGPQIRTAERGVKLVPFLSAVKFSVSVRHNKQEASSRCQRGFLPATKQTYLCMLKVRAVQMCAALWRVKHKQTIVHLFVPAGNSTLHSPC